jgi:hypothetical protein
MIYALLETDRDGVAIRINLSTDFGELLAEKMDLFAYFEDQGTENMKLTCLPGDGVVLSGNIAPVDVLMLPINRVQFIGQAGGVPLAHEEMRVEVFRDSLYVTCQIDGSEVKSAELTRTDIQLTEI